MACCLSRDKRSEAAFSSSCCCLSLICLACSSISCLCCSKRCSWTIAIITRERVLKRDGIDPNDLLMFAFSWVKFGGSWWELGSYTIRLSSHTPLAGPRMSSYSSLMSFRPCPNHDNYSSVVEMSVCLSISHSLNAKFKNVFRNFKKHFR